MCLGLRPSLRFNVGLLTTVVVQHHKTSWQLTSVQNIKPSCLNGKAGVTNDRKATATKMYTASCSAIQFVVNCVTAPARYRQNTATIYSKFSRLYSCKLIGYRLQGNNNINATVSCTKSKHSKKGKQMDGEHCSSTIHNQATTALLHMMNF